MSHQHVLAPRERLNSTLEITPEWLRSRSLRGLVVDIDNTLVPFGFEGDLPELKHWAIALHEAGIPVRILSNAAPDRIGRWSHKLNIPAVGLFAGTAAKPWPGGFRRAAFEMNLEPACVGMVGDQVFTDVLGGNLAGLYTILVKPIADNDLPHTRLARSLERFVLERLG